MKAALLGQLPRCWSYPEQFEKLWAAAQVSLAQACDRLRKLQQIYQLRIIITITMIIIATVTIC